MEKRIAAVVLLLVFAACKRGENKKDGTPAPAVTAAAASKAEGMHVWDPNTVLFDVAQAGAKEIERVPIGTALAVERVASSPEYLRVVDGTKKQGFVLARAVREGTPEPAGLLESAREKLAGGDLPGALEDGERTAALGGAPTAEALDLLEAIHEAQGNAYHAQRVRERRKSAKLPAPTPTPDAGAVPSTTAAPGAARWVSATVLLLKEKPDVSARTVAEIPIGTEAKVTSVKGEWLEIEAKSVTSSIFRIEDDGEIQPIGGEDRVVRGFARPRFLAEAALSRDAIVAEADALEAKGDLPEAVRRLERASALDPDPALVQRLARLAAKAKLYRIAARASARLTRGADRAGEFETVDRLTVWGCRGDLGRSVIAAAAQGASSADACVGSAPALDGCAPCAPSGMEVTEEELAAQQTAYEKEQRVWDVNLAAWQKERDALRTKFPAGPYARLTVPPSKESGSLFAWSRSVKVLDDYCGNLILGWGSTRVSLPIPAKSDRERTFWIAVDDPDTVIFGIDAAASADALRKELETCGEEGSDSQACEPLPAQFPKLRPCGCCGC